jgi:hypothetical protein
MRVKLLFYLTLISAQVICAQEILEKPTEPYRQLIFTETRHVTGTDVYVELTNVGDKTIRLSDFYLYNMWGGNHLLTNIERNEFGELVNGYFSPAYDATYRAQLPDSILAPGESFVICSVWDGLIGGDIVQRRSLVKKANMFVHRVEGSTDTTIFTSSFPEYQNYDFDSVSVHHQLLRGGSDAHSNAWVLVNRYYDLEGQVADSVLIDVVNFGISEGGAHQLQPLQNIAGVESATASNILVRKASVTTGNLNWDVSRGVSSEDSEWLLVPHFTGRKVYTTIGEHGNFGIDITSESLVIDIANAKIIAPWGIRKGDSLIINNMVLGPGMAWVYRENQDNFDGLGHVICQTGDILTMYATGNELTTVNFQIEIDASADDVTRVFPRRLLTFPNDVPTWGGVPYYVTNYQNVVDTIGNVPYNLLISTLLERLEKSPGASWEIIYVDGDNSRIASKNGDILRVTAANGVNTEDYYINVLSYTGSGNSNLSAIIWPDKPGYLDGWKEDTIPGFQSNVRNYVVTLPYGTANVPALQAVPANLNANISFVPAKNLTSVLETDRTTIFQVTSEDSTSVTQYRVVFRIDRPEFLEQKWQAEPFISELILNQHANNSFAEICNPGDHLLDMSNYLFTISNATNNPAQAIAGVLPQLEGNYAGRYDYNGAYIPGMKWPATREEWEQNGNVMVYDPIVNPFVESGEVFIIGRANLLPNTSLQAGRANVILGRHLNTWEEFDVTERAMLHIRRGARGIFLFKILNDSILTGQKPIQDISDFELIDFFGPAVNGADWVVGGTSIPVAASRSLQRKPHWVIPSALPETGWGTNEEDSDWNHILQGSTFQGELYDGNNLGRNLGVHEFIPYRGHISTVSSNIYIVSEGYQGEQSIRGVYKNENVEQFFANLIKANEDQIIEVLSGETVRGPSELVSHNDYLRVTSADGEHFTLYTISTVNLDDNTLLTAASGSGLVIERDGTSGTVSGFDFGTSVSSVLSKVISPVTAELRIVNETDELVSLQLYNTEMVKGARTASDAVYFKVVAEDKTSYTKYRLLPGTSASDAYVLSDVYTVLQPEPMAITMIQPNTSVKTLLSNLIPSSGASMTVYDAAGKVRDMGFVDSGDFLYVRSEDGSALNIYNLIFIGESGEIKPRQIPAPVSGLRIEAITTDSTEVIILWDYTSEFEHGFVILRDGVEIGRTQDFSFSDSGLTPGVSYRYTVYAYNELGDSEERSVDFPSTPTGIDRVITGKGILVFPNPTEDVVYLENLPANSRVIVMDILGRKIREIKPDGNQCFVALGSEPTGIYLVIVLENNETILTKRVVKK